MAQVINLITWRRECMTRTNWQVIDESQPKPQRRWPISGVLAILSIILLFAVIACLGVAALLYTRGLLPPAFFVGGDVAETTTALVGPDMQVIVVKLRQPVVLERAVMVLGNGDEIETVTPTTEEVNTIAFFVPLEGGSSVPGKIMVRHKAGNISYNYEGNAQ